MVQRCIWKIDLKENKKYFTFRERDQIIWYEAENYALIIDRYIKTNLCMSQSNTDNFNSIA